jgi:hypothetical protein
MKDGRSQLTLTPVAHGGIAGFEAAAACLVDYEFQDILEIIIALSDD